MEMSTFTNSQYELLQRLSKLSISRENYSELANRGIMKSKGSANMLVCISYQVPESMTKISDSSGVRLWVMIDGGHHPRDRMIRLEAAKQTPWQR